VNTIEKKLSLISNAVLEVDVDEASFENVDILSISWYRKSPKYLYITFYFFHKIFLSIMICLFKEE